MQGTDRRDSINRRDFLIGGVGMAAVLGAPAIVRGQNLNSKISLGIVGTGSRACEILRATADHTERIITDVCDIYP
ncbi:hypothetical protein LLH00_19620, partial [bacterium]|nr:hypothetical protein [bacterium]